MCILVPQHNLSKGSLVQCYHSQVLTFLCYSSMGQAGIGQLWILCLLLFPSSICIYGKYMHKKAAELSQRQYTTLDGNLEKIISKCVLLVSSSQITIEIKVNYHFPFRRHLARVTFQNGIFLGGDFSQLCVCVVDPSSTTRSK